MFNATLPTIHTVLPLLNSVPNETFSFLDQLQHKFLIFDFFSRIFHCARKCDRQRAYRPSSSRCCQIYQHNTSVFLVPSCQTKADATYIDAGTLAGPLEVRWGMAMRFDTDNWRRKEAGDARTDETLTATISAPATQRSKRN